MNPATPPTLSIVIPVRDEVENISSLADEIRRTFEESDPEWECIWVDDGSRDGTLAALRALREKDGRHGYISFDRNHGQTAALLAGFRHARGEIIATLDGDGQNDPSDLPPLVQRVLDGKADMINGVRSRRRDSWLRRISSRIGNGFRNRITRENVTDVGCSLRVLRRSCVEEFPPFEGLHRFFPTLVGIHGWRIIESPVSHRPRSRGRTKYGIHNRLWRGLHDTLAVRWMQRRWIRYRIVEEGSPRTERQAP